MITVDIDVGGTFTDGFFTRGGGTAWRAKVPTTPHDLSSGILDCVTAGAQKADLGLEAFLADTAVARLSTTLGTNSLLERTGPRLGLLVRAGRGGDLYGAAAALADLVPAELVRELTLPLREAQVMAAVRELLTGGSRVLVVSLGDPGAERSTKAMVQERYPEHYLRRVLVQTAADLTDDRDGAARTATAVLNAYLHPVMVRSLYKIEDDLRSRGLRRPLLVVHNSGGVVRVAKTTALRTYSSGPVAGLFGAVWLARALGLDPLITLDMGGTSTDIGLVQGGQAMLPLDPAVAGIRVSLPMYRTRSVGAGGGSIARVDHGRLQVGPESAGATPGPACYGRGGDRPTVTDADLVLGFLAADRFLGGNMPLELDRARAALAEYVGSSLGTAPEPAAHRVRSWVDQYLGRVLQSTLAESGARPEACTLLAIGGAGPLHACAAARPAGIRRVLAVPYGSVFNAFGASTMDVAHVYTRSLSPGQDPEQVVALLRKGAEVDMRGEGCAPADVQYEVSVHQGKMILRASCSVAHWTPSPNGSATGAAVTPAGTRRTWWGRGGADETGVYDHASLPSGAALQGPALVEYPDTCLAIPPGWRCTVDAYRNCRLEWEDPA